MIQTFYWLLRLFYDDQIINYSSLPVLLHDEEINGESVSFFGLGSLVSVTGLTNHADLTVDEITVAIRLSYEGEINNEGYSLITQNDITGSKVDLYLVKKDDDFTKTIRRVFRGIADSPTVSLSPNDGAVTISVKNELAKWKVARHFKYSHENQISRFAGDYGLIYMKDVIKSKIDW